MSFQPLMAQRLSLIMTNPMVVSQVSGQEQIDEFATRDGTIGVPGYAVWHSTRLRSSTVDYIHVVK